MRIAAAKLTELVCDLLMSAGTSDDHARVVAGGFVESNLVGHDSHGVIQIPRYLRAIQQGRINLKANMEIVRDHPGSAVIDADWGFGQIAARMAMDVAVAKARKQSVACVSVFNCNDVSRLGRYSVMACRENCLGMITVNDGGANPYVAPWGSRARLMSTNPISVGIPMGDRPPICIDMATSVVAGGKIALARQRGEKLPPGCIINANGELSIDPKEFFESPGGALLPLGGSVAGHKGFALNLMVDILSGGLSGAGCSGSAQRDGQGVFVMVINIEAFTPFSQFVLSVTELVERIKALPKAEGFDEILIPGEPEWRQKARRLEEGILVDEATRQALTRVAEHLGVYGLWE